MEEEDNIIFKDYPMLYTNLEYVHIRNKTIEEFDIVQGGYNIALYNNLLTEDEQNDLRFLSKHERHVYIGNRSKDKEFTEKLFKGFIKSITEFRRLNNIQNDSILSIKKDAITIINTKIHKPNIDNIQFVSKGKATSYFNINKKEFFYNNEDDSLVVKGLNDLVVKNHPLIHELKYLIKLSEYAKKNDIFKYLQELRHAYLNRDLTNEYYSELSPLSAYKLNTNSIQGTFYSKYINDDNILDVDISYNYINFILPFIRILV